MNGNPERCDILVIIQRWCNSWCNSEKYHNNDLVCQVVPEVTSKTRLTISYFPLHNWCQSSCWQNWHHWISWIATLPAWNEFLWVRHVLARCETWRVYKFFPWGGLYPFDARWPTNNSGVLLIYWIKLASALVLASEACSLTVLTIGKVCSLRFSLTIIWTQTATPITSITFQ